MIKDPVFIIIDARPLLNIANIYPKLFIRFPIRDFIELLLTIPYGINIEEFIDDQIKSRFSVLEITELNPELLEIVISSIDDAVYGILENKNINLENIAYMFFSWVDEFTLLLAREDRFFDGVSSNELYTKFKDRRTLPNKRLNSRYRYSSRF